MEAAGADGSAVKLIYTELVCVQVILLLVLVVMRKRLELVVQLLSWSILSWSVYR